MKNTISKKLVHKNRTKDDYQKLSEYILRPVYTVVSTQIESSLWTKLEKAFPGMTEQQIVRLALKRLSESNIVTSLFEIKEIK